MITDIETFLLGVAVAFATTLAVIRLILLEYESILKLLKRVRWKVRSTNNPSHPMCNEKSTKLFIINDPQIPQTSLDTNAMKTLADPFDSLVLTENLPASLPDDPIAGKPIVAPPPQEARCCRRPVFLRSHRVISIRTPERDDRYRA